VDTARRRVTRADQVEQTRRRILASASEVFALNGFHGASLEDITARAGLSRAAVYRYFPSKDELFAAMLTAEMSALGELTSTAEDPSPGRSDLTADVGPLIRQLLSLERWHKACLEFTSIRPQWRASPALDQCLRRVLLQLCSGPDAQPAMAIDELARTIEALACGFYALSLDPPGFDPAPLLTETVHALLAGVHASLSSCEDLESEDAVRPT